MHKNPFGFSSPLAGLLGAFVQEKRDCGYKYETALDMLRQLDRMWSVPGHPSPDLSREWADRFIRLRPGESPHGPAHRARVWRELARHAHRNGMDAHVPASHTMPLARESFAPYIFSRSQIAALFSVIDNLPAYGWSPRRPWIMALLFRLLYGTGMRLGEARRLEAADFDPKNETLLIREGKNRRDRIVALAPSLADRLREYLQQFPGEANTPLFLSPILPRPLSKTAIRDAFHDFVTKAGLPPRLDGNGPRIHDLRHTFAVHRLENWYRAGENLEAKLPVLAAYMGHSHMRETYYYLRITASFFPEIGRRLEAFVGEVIPQGASL